MRVLFLFFLCLAAFANGEADRRIQRIGAISRIWAEVKFSHPGLAAPPDLDALFVRALADLKAGGDHEFRQAVGGFLHGIGDPATKPVGEAFKTMVEPDPSRKWKDIERVDAETLLVRMNDMIRIQGEEANFREALSRELRNAKFVIFDMRPNSTVNGVPLPARYDADYLRRIFGQVLPLLISKPLPIPNRVKRFHYGYAGLGEYFWSGNLHSDARTIRPAAGGTSKRIGVLVNPATILPIEVIALRNAGQAMLVSEGFETDFAAEVQTVDVEPGYQVQVRVSNVADGKGLVRGTPDLVVPPSSEMSLRAPSVERIRRMLRRPVQASSASISRRSISPWPADRDFSETAFPSREHRILAAVRFWATIDRLYPYKRLLDNEWDAQLPGFIRAMEAAGTTGEYQLALQRIVATINDSHGALLMNDGAFMSPRPPSVESALGGGRSPADVRIVDENVVVTAVGDGDHGIRVGDILVSIDGESCSRRLERIRDLICASTPQSFRLLAANSLLRGPAGQFGTLSLRRPDGTIYQTRIQWVARATYQRKGDVFRSLGDGIGYVDLGRLQPDSLEPVKALLKGSRSAILDMRGYPTPAANALLMFCLKHPKKPAVRFDMPLGLYSSEFDRAQTVQSISYVSESSAGMAVGGEPILNIPLVLLVDESAQSFAESVAVLFEVGADATVIGSPTSGADGVVTACVLPGGLKAEFTGCGFSYADGRLIQRVGVLPKILVRPTADGLARGVDEVLEKAVSHLRAAH